MEHTCTQYLCTKLCTYNFTIILLYYKKGGKGVSRGSACMAWGSQEPGPLADTSSWFVTGSRQSVVLHKQ